jgi:hypothetical protein
MMRDFSLRLSNTPEAATAVASLISGLVDYGERVSVTPKLLKSLRDNLDFMQSFLGAEFAPESFEPNQSQTEKSFVFRIVRRSRLIMPKLNVVGRLKRKHIIGLIGLAGLVLVALATLEGVYVGFDKVRSLFPKTLVAALFQRSPLGAEAKPPVGTGQRLALDGVRYCHFQKERLRIIKQEVQGPEDARAYNLLIVDYNSRCSDFFYQDDDLKLVLAEVSAKNDLLAADAKRIMSTWPGRMADGPPRK